VRRPSNRNLARIVKSDGEHQKIAPAIYSGLEDQPAATSAEHIRNSLQNVIHSTRLVSAGSLSQFVRASRQPVDGRVATSRNVHFADSRLRQENPQLLVDQSIPLGEMI
jgi:hypothetical protein